MADIWIPQDFNNAAIDEIVTDYSNAISLRHPDGVILIDGKQVADTKQCPHCGGHYFPEKGKMRLFCRVHGASVCDNFRCNMICEDYYSEVGQLSGREF